MSAVKNENFSRKVLIFVSILFCQNLDCEYSLEPPRQIYVFDQIKNQRTIGLENSQLKPDLGAFSHHEMTLTLNTQTPLLTCSKLSASAKFQVSSCNSFQKSIVFTFFLHVKAYVSKIDLAVKYVKVIQGSSFGQTFIGWSSRCYIPSFEEICPLLLKKKIFECFYHIWTWRPSWRSCDQDIVNKISMPLPMEAPCKIKLIGQAVSEKIFQIVT